MADQEKPRSFWTTLPGILTGVAGLLTAVTGLIVAIRPHPQPPPPPSPEASRADAARSQAANQASPAAADPAGKPAASPRESAETGAINLIGSSNGGRIVVGTSPDWSRTILGPDHHEVLGGHRPEEAVLGFRDDGAAVLDAFKVLVSESRPSNLDEFELFVSSASPDGPFQSIGKFHTTNARRPEDPYQTFALRQVKAKYLKIRLLSNHNGYDNPFEVEEFQLLGRPVGE
jgi:hypothetical protein